MMKVGMIAAVAMAVMLCGCEKSNSGSGEQSKAEVRDYIIQKYSKIAPEKQIRAVFQLDNSSWIDGAERTSFLLTVQKYGLGDEFEKDMKLWESCSR